jgi:O-antigen/teichoic acid export membrane protein
LGQINFRIDTIILALVRSPSEVGYYSAAYRFVELSHSISGAVGISVFPSLNRYAATGDDRRFARLAQRALDVLLAFAAPVALVMAVFGNEILDLTAGRDFEPGGRALVLLAAFVPFGLANHLVWRLLAVAHKDRALVGISGAALFAAILLNALLIPPYGMRAAALVTVAVEVAIVGAGLAVLAREGRPLPSFRYAVPIAVAAALALVPALLVPQAAVAAVAAVAVYCAVIVALPGTVRELVLHARGELGRRRAAQ